MGSWKEKREKENGGNILLTCEVLKKCKKKIWSLWCRWVGVGGVKG